MKGLTLINLMIGTIVGLVYLVGIMPIVNSMINSITTGLDDATLIAINMIPFALVVSLAIKTLGKNDDPESVV